MHVHRGVVAVFVAVVLAGCASTPLPPPPPPPPVSAVPAPTAMPEPPLAMTAPPDDAVVFDKPCKRRIREPFPVTLFYGTNRSRTRSDKPEGYYNAVDAQGLAVGWCRVSIPPVHRCGQVETPGFVTRVLYGVDEQKHIVLQKVQQLSPNEWKASLANAVGGAKEKEVFVYVHGFNTTFEEAAQRTAQLHFDLDYPGIALFFSWPSQGGGATGLLAYRRDQELTSAAGTQLHLFLERVARDSGAKAIHVIAHSMGNLVLTESTKRADGSMWPYSAPLRQVILAAPDIGAKDMEHLAQALQMSNASRVTLYASNADVALKASVGANLRSPIGLAWRPMYKAKGIDTIDASLLDCDFLGHACTAGTPQSLQDVLTLLRNGAAPYMRRWLAWLPEGVWSFIEN